MPLNCLYAQKLHFKKIQRLSGAPCSLEGKKKAYVSYQIILNLQLDYFLTTLLISYNFEFWKWSFCYSQTWAPQEGPGHLKMCMQTELDIKS